MQTQSSKSFHARLLRGRGALCLALQERIIYQQDDVLACLQPALAMLCTGTSHFRVVTSL